MTMTIRDERLEKWPRTKEATRSHIHDYYSLVSAMDHDLGRLLDYLETSKLVDNTIIIFTSDHGLALGSHGLFGKQNVYEAGMKVPFFISGPGIKPGKTEALAYLHDIFPTVADFGSGKITAKIDGKSLRQIAYGKQDKVRQFATLAYQDSQRSIRDQRWKLMVFPQINRYQLFDLKNDPDEMIDLAAKHPEQVTRLMAMLRQQLDSTGDKQTLTVAKPKPAKFAIPKVKATKRSRAGGQSKKQTTD